jgi:tRNA (cytidine/uridine-2'-O-)-methyltransferase
MIKSSSLNSQWREVQSTGAPVGKTQTLNAQEFSLQSTDSQFTGGSLLQGQQPLFHVVLIEPEIPQNTGNIGRTCVGLNSSLHLVGPMGFELSHTRLKRAGLDYWPHLDWCYYESRQIWKEKFSSQGRRYYFSAKATQSYYDVTYCPGDVLVFGKETAGLPEDMLEEDPAQNVLLPMLGQVRGYNLATAVAIGLFEAYRQVRQNL